MYKEDLIDEYAIDIAIEKISQKITELTEEYKKTKQKSLKMQLLNLIEDRSKIYNNDKNVIKKYIEE